MTPDRPSNQQLHNENEKKLSELLKLREQQDKGIFTSTVQAAQDFYKPWQQSDHTLHK